MKKILVVGAGTMGLDIAQVFAKKDLDVTVRDISDEILVRAKDKLEKGMAKLVEKGRMTEEARTGVLKHITFTTDLKAAADVDLVVEAVLEVLDVKKSLFKELDGICKPETIFASNTSSISITEIASATKRPDRFIGMHFFNPATVMKLIEVIRGAHTTDETFKKVYDLSSYIGKEPVEVQEAPAFVVNRILIPMINEAIALYAQGTASVADIDKAMMLGANHPMGPLTLADFVGLDIVLHVLDTIYSETGDPRYAAHPLLRKMVRGGILGKKSGKGFYDYSK
ncbi:3-hydroxyacyl-CoA dehydrogenase family protein [Papillibacter cinnamivorans]|uniref:3-hydroxybutyryl-CoA dehydrogenase n=1 Tax=Papillibacter cinnamivorans DSM 12816 TaxID=1122930 RepID=A0A1W1ZLB3_9FIRM|nr:3-hydroxybutyryl-CoA dehydrogenase [Papillibacter cinnamivorans]SMC49002.1 3-hydroxybutyryl-CoA dehydrogenase [Papillibacter cinnamivorans DSM 12816]